MCSFVLYTLLALLLRCIVTISLANVFFVGLRTSQPIHDMCRVTILGSLVFLMISGGGDGMGMPRFDVGLHVEVPEEDEHGDHVPGEQLLSPTGEVAGHVERVHCMDHCAAELDLENTLDNW